MVESTPGESPKTLMGNTMHGCSGFVWLGQGQALLVQQHIIIKQKLTKYQNKSIEIEKF